MMRTGELFLPLFFANSGINTNIGALDTGKYWQVYYIVIVNIIILLLYHD